MAAGVTYRCPKCAGAGRLACYANVAGGVCFSCGGSGVKVGRPPARSPRFAISAVRLVDGQRLTVFFLKAKDQAEALSKATRTLARGTAYDAASAEAWAA